jgi:hypothetical protein
MTTTADQAACARRPDVARFAIAGAFLEALAEHNFERLGSTLSDDAHLHALVPRGLREWDGPDGVCAAFTHWFGDVDDFQLVEAVIGDVGPRLHLHWRVRVRAQRLGDGWFVVEQQVYADTNASGLITYLRLLCSGYCPEQ